MSSTPSFVDNVNNPNVDLNVGNLNCDSVGDAGGLDFNVESLNANLSECLNTDPDGSAGVINLGPDIENNASIDDALSNTLPPDYSYIVKNYMNLPLQTFAGRPKFAYDATVLNEDINNVEEINSWLTKYKEKTSTVLRVTRKYETSKKTPYHYSFHCQHANVSTVKKYSVKEDRVDVKGISKGKRQRSTDCEFSMSVLWRENEEGKYQCTIKIHFDHNHPIHAYAVLSHQPVDESTVETYHRYFEDGLGPAQARHRHTRYLSLQASEVELQTTFASRSSNPDIEAVKYIYKKWNAAKHGPLNGKGMWDHFEKVVEDFNSAGKGIAKLQAYDGMKGREFLLIVSRKFYFIFLQKL
jgi:hypothetical protein